MTVCADFSCGRPARAKGLCSMHYKRAQRGPTAKSGFGQTAGQGLAPESKPSRSHPTKCTPSDQDFVHKNHDLSQTNKVRVANGGLMLGETVQAFGIVCRDCRHVKKVTWCTAECHPLFDLSGRLIRGPQQKRKRQQRPKGKE